MFYINARGDADSGTWPVIIIQDYIFLRRHYPDQVHGYNLSPTMWSTPASIY